MSETAVAEPPVETPEVFAVGSIPLLKEYFEKVSSFQERVRGLWAKYNNRDEKLSSVESMIYRAEFGALEQYFMRLLPAMQRFTQQISGMVDQGKVTPLVRSELQLRLAELEAVLTQLPNLMQVYRPRPIS
ncbi:hypothetical protein J0H58_34055 [bacterium]|nr:hypothetical protein [bacterium]